VDALLGGNLLNDSLKLTDAPFRDHRDKTQSFVRQNQA
jgi:hypothetical protein